MKTVFLIMGKYDAVRMNTSQMADFMNVTVATVQNRIYARNMPFPPSTRKEAGTSRISTTSRRTTTGCGKKPQRRTREPRHPSGKAVPISSSHHATTPSVLRICYSTISRLIVS